ncbi:Uncharacterised protein g207 [Pycnogonum litorale]
MSGIGIVAKKIGCAPFRNASRISQFYQRGCSGKASGHVASQSPTAQLNESAMKATHQPNRFEKWILVRMKRYPTMDAVPNFVTQSEVHKARNKMLIYGNILVAIIASIGCYVMAIRGKKAAERGESVSSINRAWHEKVNAESNHVDHKQ